MTVELPPYDETTEYREHDDDRDETLTAHAETLAAAADLAHWCALLGHGTKAGRRAFEWITHPRLGDLVLVNDVWTGQHPLDLVGTYLGAWVHIGPPDFGDEQIPYIDRGRELVYWIATLDGRAIKWGNCSLLRIPRNCNERREVML